MGSMSARILLRGLRRAAVAAIGATVLLHLPSWLLGTLALAASVALIPVLGMEGSE